MAPDRYLNVLLDADIADRRDQERYGRFLDEALRHERVTLDEVVGVGEKGTGGNPDLYVVHRKAIVLVSERGIFNKRVEVERVSPLASIARLRGTQEGFKGNEVTITAHDASGEVIFKIVWGLGGPDWVEPLILRQRQQLFDVISKAMDKLAEVPDRASVSSAPSKAGALRDWAADVVREAGVGVTPDRVEEHANMIAGGIRMFGFLPLARLDDLRKFYPNGDLPQGSPIETFDDLYAHVVAHVGNAHAVDRVIDEHLAGSWAEFVNGCRETYA